MHLPSGIGCAGQIDDQVCYNAVLIEMYPIMKPVIIRIMKRGKSRQDFRTSTMTVGPRWVHYHCCAGPTELQDRVDFVTGRRRQLYDDMRKSP